MPCFFGAASGLLAVVAGASVLVSTAFVSGAVFLGAASFDFSTVIIFPSLRRETSGSLSSLCLNPKLRSTRMPLSSYALGSSQFLSLSRDLLFQCYRTSLLQTAQTQLFCGRPRSALNINVP